MQTKLDALTREVFDLQETINWKDKKIAVGGPTCELRGGDACVLQPCLRGGDPGALAHTWTLQASACL